MNTNLKQNPDPSKREAAALKLVRVINSSRTAAHIKAARRMVGWFQKRYDDTLPLMRWVLAKEFEILNGQ